MSELKPCPFCGSDDRIILIPSDNSLMADYRSKDEVYCRDCGANQYALGKLKAIKKWNTRPVEDALRTENEALKARVAELEAKNADLFTKGQIMYEALEKEVSASERAYEILELPNDTPTEVAINAISALKAKGAELERDNQRMRQALEKISNGDTSKNVCEYIATTPTMLTVCINIAKKALQGGDA